MGDYVDHDQRRARTLFADDSDGSEGLELTLRIVDRETIDELAACSDGEEREQFAQTALRIGVLALRQARGRVDADLIQRETQRMLSALEGHLTAHAAEMQQKLTGSLKEYFDPQSGRFSERVQQLVKQDGDLEQLLRRQIGGEDSELCKTLLNHVGQQSPLMKVLNPSESSGLMQALATTVEAKLAAQRDHVLKEFSLDNKQGALARMIVELTTTHGQLTETLQKKIDVVVGEFSLDKDDSALSRLVRNVDRAQRTITQEFSLDSDNSALARMKGELVKLFTEHADANSRFQEEVKLALAKMAARREEADRTTQHGLIFEDAVCQFLEFHAQRTGDLVTRCGNLTGLIKNCKKGDCLVELAPDSAAPGAKVVIEAKDEAGFTIGKAREEIETARSNRDAQIGLFIFAKATAPTGIEEVFRFGNDVFVVWDAEDGATNLQLKVGVTLARALCVRACQASQSQSADFEAITKAILEIEKQSQFLGEVTTSAETIKKGADNVLERIRKTRTSLERQVETLQSHIHDLKNTLNAAETA